MRTHFWIDSWLDHGPLKLQYPRLFALSTSPQAMISDMAGDYFNEGTLALEIILEERFEAYRDGPTALPSRPN
jgi:hypothetical protein